jgi:hypothetical protein
MRYLFPYFPNIRNIDSGKPLSAPPGRTGRFIAPVLMLRMTADIPAG